MYFNDYQHEAVTFAVYENELYPFLALCEEAGELAGVVAKHIRNGGTLDTLSPEQRQQILEEGGDVLWDLANALCHLGITLDEAAVTNLLKLRSRKAVGTLSALQRSEV